MITTILLDLDGTLLPMEQEAFVQAYFKLLAAKMAPHGYDPKRLVEAIWTGTKAMVGNDGSRSNEEAFWNCFADIFGEKVRDDLPLFDEFYREDFQKAQSACGHTPEAAALIAWLKERGYRLVLATNPIFPRVATESRMRWAGVSPDDFLLYTTYETTGFCKPNPEYYRDILTKLSLNAEECVMVGNDVEEDMAAERLGMRVFLLTDCLINAKQAELSGYAKGSFRELRDWLSKLRSGEAR
ncbi:MAG: HAD family hydrolase [Lachnospiraceae bacterium]|nr:HAD family hydrolase [Lachnospiraceae bacterium]